jgi:hypothetical protein
MSNVKRRFTELKVLSSEMDYEMEVLESLLVF